MGTYAIKHPVPDRVKPSFVIFDIPALCDANPWTSDCPDVKYYKWWLTRYSTGCLDSWRQRVKGNSKNIWPVKPTPKISSLLASFSTIIWHNKHFKEPHSSCMWLCMALAFVLVHIFCFWLRMTTLSFSVHVKLLYRISHWPEYKPDDPLIELFARLLNVSENNISSTVKFSDK